MIGWDFGPAIRYRRDLRDDDEPAEYISGFWYFRKTHLTSGVDLGCKPLGLVSEVDGVLYVVCFDFFESHFDLVMSFFVLSA